MNVRLTASLAALVLSAAFLSGPTVQAAPVSSVRRSR